MKATDGVSAAQAYSEGDYGDYLEHLDGPEFGAPFDFDAAARASGYAPSRPRAPHLVAVPTPRLRRSFRADRAQALEELERRDAARDPVVLIDRDDAHGPLERATRTYRYMQMRAYRSKAAAARELMRKTVDVYTRLVSVGADDVDAVAWQARKVESRIKWYEGRAAAQLPRFDTVRQCGAQALRVNCRCCASDLCTLPCRCGVVRVCDGCAETVAKKRQKRIANARVAVILDGESDGVFLRNRWGGSFGEKMLTLTVPHVTWAECSGDVCDTKNSPGLVWGSDVAVRMTALRLAWPKFLRSMRRWLASDFEGPRRARRGSLAKRWRAGEQRDGDPLDVARTRYYRFFEWTRGLDGKGHPHFHVYLFSPFIPLPLVRKWWAAALESVGCPVPRAFKRCDDYPGERCAYAADVLGRHVIVDIRALEGFNYQALRELVKSGSRQAIEDKLGTLRAPGLDAVTYANAWTMSHAFKDLPPEARDHTIEVQRDLYIAGEGRRFAQGSRGFLEPEAPPVCDACGNSIFSAKVLGFDDETNFDSGAGEPREETGPPS